MKDFLGQEITAGSWIIYGRRDHNSSKTSLYKVESVEDGCVKARATHETNSRDEVEPSWMPSLSRITNTSRVVVVPETVVLAFVSASAESTVEDSWNIFGKGRIFV